MQTGPLGVEQLLGWLPMPPAPPALEAATRRTESLTTRWWSQSAPPLLNELVGTWEELLGDPAFRTAPLDYRLICHDRAALAFCWRALTREVDPESDLAAAREHLALVARHDPTWADDLTYHRAVYHYNAGTIRGDVHESQQAVLLLREVLARLPPTDTRLRPRCIDVLARSMMHQHADDLDRSAGLLDQVIAWLTEALEGLVPDAPYRGLVAVSLAKALSRRFQVTGRLADLDAAIATLEANPIVQTYRYANAVRATELGIHHGSRYRLLRDDDDLRRSIEWHGRAVASAPKGSISYQDALAQRGHALLWGYEQTGDVSLVEQALRVQEEAVEITTVEHPLYPGRLSGLGNALAATFHLTGHRPHLDRALELYERAIALSPAGDTGLAGLHYNAGNTRYARHRLTRRRRDRVAAVRHYRQACVLGLDVDPEWALGAARQWARLADERGAWRESTEAYRFAVDAVERLFSGQTSRTHKEAWLRTADGLPAAAGYAFFRAGRPVDAVLIQERGRALLLAEALRGEGGTIGAAGRYLGIDDVYAAAGTGPLVYLDPAGEGGVALVVDPRARRVRAVALPGLREAAVRHHVGMLRAAYHGRHDDPGTWLGTVDAVTRWSYDAVMGPLLAALPGVAAVTLVPVGRLSMLPLHAAWAPERTGDDRRFVLDRVDVSYTATARALATARDGLGGARESALVVDEPAPVRAPPLPLSHVERAAVGLVTGSVRVLAGRSATREAVLSALGDGGHHLIHMSCHGRGHPESPLDSGLLMAGDQMLRLGDLHDLERGGGVRPRLVMLSACETDQPGTELPDEVISLPSGLIQAGCRGVVAAQWAVSSLAAALLTVRFYQVWRPGTDPGAALAAAQRWLRELTNAELAALARPENGGSALGLPASASRPLWMAARRRPPGERRFAHPASWGAFAHVGV
jgi:CHAT domain-containing protein/tetratricopeptide (TPR) repeat protein